MDSGDDGLNSVVFGWAVWGFEVGEGMGVLSGVEFGFWRIGGVLTGGLTGFFGFLLVKVVAEW